MAQAVAHCVRQGSDSIQIWELISITDLLVDPCTLSTLLLSCTWAAFWQIHL